MTQVSELFQIGCVLRTLFRGDAKHRTTMCTAHRRISRFRVWCYAPSRN